MSLVNPSIGWLNRLNSLNGEFVVQFLSLWRLWNSLSNPHLILETAGMRGWCPPLKESISHQTGQRKSSSKMPQGDILVKEISLLFSKNIHDSDYDHIHPALGGRLCWKIKGPWRPRDDFWCCQTMRDFSLSYWFVVSFGVGLQIGCSNR